MTAPKRPNARGEVVCVSDKGNRYVLVFGRFEVARIGRDEARRVAA